MKGPGNQSEVPASRVGMIVIDPLEPRTIMSAQPAGAVEEILSADDGSGIWRTDRNVLVIRGTRAVDVIDFNDHYRSRGAGDPRHVLQITLNGVQRELVINDIVHLRINGRGGDDHIWMTRLAPPMATVEDHEIAIPAFIRGGAGRDNIRGGARNDTVDGGPGDDWLRGEGGDDRILGGPGDDAISGNVDHDRLDGNGGNDHLTGGIGRDSIAGGAGDDTLSNREASGLNMPDDRDWLDGGAGNDLAQQDDRDRFRRTERRTP